MSSLFDKIICKPPTQCQLLQSQLVSSPGKMFPPNYRSLKVPPLAKNIPKLDKDVIIKQAHQSFVVLGNSENESKDRTAEKIDSEKNNPVNVPFQTIDLSRLRSPNIPYVGKTANRNKVSDVHYPESDLDISKPNQRSARFSDEHEYIDISDEERQAGLASSYPLERSELKNKLYMGRDLSTLADKKENLGENELIKQKETAKAQDRVGRSDTRNKTFQRRNISQSPAKNGRHRSVNNGNRTIYFDKKGVDSPNKQVSKGKYVTKNKPYQSVKSNQYGNTIKAYEDDLSGSGNDSILSNQNSPMKYSSNEITKGLKSSEKNVTGREGTQRHRRSSIMRDFTDESSSEEEITITKKKKKSAKVTKTKASENIKKWPLQGSWALNQTQELRLSGRKIDNKESIDSEKSKILELMEILDTQKLKKLDQSKIKDATSLHSSASSIFDSTSSENEIFDLENDVKASILNEGNDVENGTHDSQNGKEGSNGIREETGDSNKKKKLKKSNSWDISIKEEGDGVLDKKKVLKYSSCDESKRGSQSDIFYKKEVIKYSSYEKHKPKPNIIKPNSPINKISTFESIKIGDLASANRKEVTVLTRKTDIDIESTDSIESNDTKKEKEQLTSENQEDVTIRDPLADEDIENDAEDVEKTRASSASSGSSSGYSIVPVLGKPNDEDLEYEHLDFDRDDQLAAFCKERLNRVTERTLNVLLIEMRKADRDRDMVLPPSTIDALILQFKLPLKPCLSYLHKKFRDQRFIGSTNYEQVMKFLENSRAERHKTGPEEIQDWKKDLDKQRQTSWMNQQNIMSEKFNTENAKNALHERKKEWSAQEEAKLIIDLEKNLGKQVIDLDMLANTLREKDHNETDQISAQVVDKVVKMVGIKLDSIVMQRWLKAASGPVAGTCTISHLIEIMRKATNPLNEVKNLEAKGGKTDNPVPLDTSENESDTSWKQLLQFRSSQPRYRRKGSIVDACMKHKNIRKLKNAMMLSYHQHEGYLPPKEVVNLALAYSTVYHLGFDQGLITSAINNARSMDIRHGLVNIDKFIQFITDNHE